MGKGGSRRAGGQDQDRLERLDRPVTDEAIFKASKEIVVKFIETGRLSPAGFAETFDMVYQSLRRSVRGQ